MKFNYRSVPIGELCQGIYDGPHATPAPSDSGAIFLGISNFVNGKLNLSPSSIRYISEEDYPKWTKRVTPKAHDIVFSYEATLNLYAIIPDGFHGCLGRRMALMRPDEDVVDYRFLYYHMFSPAWREEIERYKVNGSTVDRIPLVSFPSFRVDLPDMRTQKAIADILFAIDQKIDSNSKVNDNLAELLQTIYQGRFGNDILAVNQGVLSDICSYSTDKVAVSELNVRTYFSTENMLSGKAGSTEATSLPTTSQTTACHKGDTLISNIRPYFKKIVYCEDKCGCSTDVLCFTPSQPCYSAYLFSTLYADKFFAFMVAGSKGTKMPRGDKQQIMTYPVVLPSEEELAGFNTIASPLLEQIYSNRAENKRLSILRDTLLPKLMSGEINVSAIQL